MSLEYCIFELGRGTFGLPLAQVQEVIPLPETTAVPLSHPCLRGVSNLRGQSLSVFSVESFLGLTEKFDGLRDRILVFGEEDAAFGVVVDRVDTGIVFEAGLRPHAMSALFPALEAVGEYHKMAWQTPPESQQADPNAPAPMLVPDLTVAPISFTAIHLDRLKVVLAKTLRYDELLN